MSQYIGKVPLKVSLFVSKENFDSFDICPLTAYRRFFRMNRSMPAKRAAYRRVGVCSTLQHGRAPGIVARAPHLLRQVRMLPGRLRAALHLAKQIASLSTQGEEFMLIPNVALYPASRVAVGDEILTGNMSKPSSYTVVQINRLTVCYEIICEPYRRFVMMPYDGLWIIPHTA